MFALQVQPGSGRISPERNGNPTSKNSCLENLIDFEVMRGAVVVDTGFGSPLKSSSKLASAQAELVISDLLSSVLHFHAYNRNM